MCLLRFVFLVAVVGACNAVDPTDGPIPPPPDAGSAVLGSPETFAVDAILLGDTTRDGLASQTAWRALGYDLDQHVTSKDSSDVCVLHGSAPLVSQADGVNGTDNAWGSSLVPVLQTATSDPLPSQTQTGVLQSGAWTLEIDVDGAPPGLGNVVGVHVQLFVGAPFPSAPSFEPAQDWPVRASSVASDGEAKLRTDDAYVEAGRLVARFPTTAELDMPLLLNGGVTLVLPVRDVVVSFARNGDALSEGTLAGVLDTEATVAAFRQLAARISESLCGSAFDGIADQLRQSQDILADGTNAPGVSCDAISIGLGFTARKIANPTNVAPDPVLDDRCASLDAGLDAPGD